MFFPLILLELFHLGLMCFFASHPCLMAKSLTGTTTAASGSGLELCPTQTLMASLSFGGKIRRKSRKPLKLEVLEEVGRSLMVFGGSALFCCAVIMVIWCPCCFSKWCQKSCWGVSTLQGRDADSIMQHLKSVRRKSRVSWQIYQKRFLLSQLEYLIFSSSMLTDAVALCFFNGAFSSVRGYGGVLVLLSMDCLSCSVFKFWTNEWLEPKRFINADC